MHIHMHVHVHMCMHCHPQVTQLGTKWSRIAQFLPGRTDNAVKNRWNSRTRRMLRQQLKDEGGDSPMPQRCESVPAKRVVTSVEVATATAAAAASVITAAAAIARGRSAPATTQQLLARFAAGRPSSNQASLPMAVALGSRPLPAGEKRPR